MRFTNHITIFIKRFSKAAILCIKTKKNNGTLRPEGAIVLFSLYTKDGSLAESLDKNGNVISESHIDQFLK